MDISHCFVERGTGEPLLLLHGNGASSDYFVGQISAFSPRYHVYAIDTRGHGKTPRGNAPFTIRQFSEDLLDFLEQHGMQRVNLLGFSDGGNIALVFALCHPERVDRLILNGANLDAKGVKKRYQLPIELGYRVAKRFARRSEKAKAHAELLGLMVNDPNIRPHELERIKAPTLVIAGTRDLIKSTHTKLIAERIPDAQLVLLPGDHFIAAKEPEVFNETVLRFLQETETRQ